MRTLFRRAIWGAVGVPCMGALALLGAAELRWDRTFEAPYPDLHATADSAIIEQGRYLVNGPAHCAYCHTTPDRHAAIDAGAEVPMAGGGTFALPFGTVYTPNLTPDPETGIGRRSDPELARMLRHGVRPDGRSALAFMPFQNLSDDDVVAVLSYLRAQEPVRHAVPDHEINLLGKALMAFLIEPKGPDGTPPATSPPAAPTVERGAYLANSVANCAGCHTNRDMMDGSAIGPPFAGGLVMEDDADPSRVYVTPNLTPDLETGHIARWTEDQFVARFRAGKVFASSHMPWAAFGRMTDDDLRAIYRYLRSLPPVTNDTGALVQAKEDREA